MHGVARQTELDECKDRAQRFSGFKKAVQRTA
jgi:hypothetical protein